MANVPRAIYTKRQSQKNFNVTQSKDAVCNASFGKAC